MELFKVILSKPKLAQMSPTQRAQILLLGHALNEINVQQKLLILSMSTITEEGPPSDPGIESIVQAGQTLIILRGLIGQCSDAWELYRKRVCKDKNFAERIRGSLPPPAQAALKRLNQEFGRDGVLTNVRNKLARHYHDDDNLIEKSFVELGENEPWEFYLASTHANTFFYASELVATRAAMILASVGDNSADGLKRLCDKTTRAAGDLSNLFSELIARLVFDAIPDLEGVEISLKEPRKASETPLPFFLDEHDLRNLSLNSA